MKARPAADPGEPRERAEAEAILMEALVQLAADSPAGLAELDALGEQVRAALGPGGDRVSPEELAEAAGRLGVPQDYLAWAARALARRQAQLIAMSLGLTLLGVLIILAIVLRLR